MPPVHPTAPPAEHGPPYVEADLPKVGRVRIRWNLDRRKLEAWQAAIDPWGVEHHQEVPHGLLDGDLIEAVHAAATEANHPQFRAGGRLYRVTPNGHTATLWAADEGGEGIVRWLALGDAHDVINAGLLKLRSEERFMNDIADRKRAAPTDQPIHETGSEA